MRENVAPNDGDKRTACCITITSFFTRTFLTKSNMTIFPTHTTFMFPILKIKLKGSYFDTIEMIEAESQAVLNTVTEDDFQDAFNKWQKQWKRRMRVEGDCFEGDGGQWLQG
jgi:hypothetical protein